MKTLTPGQTLRWVLALQIGFAVVLLGTDLARTLPRLAFPSDAPDLTAPLGPGDQTRRYDPADLPPRPARPGSRPIPSSEDMPSRLLFEAVEWEGAPVLTLTGQIQPGDAARFAEFLDTASEAPVRAFLNSPGGSVRDALAIGQALRDREMETAMTGSDVCLSACPYILAGGVVRSVEEGAMVGVHQHYFGENTALPAFLAVEDIQRGQSEVMAYLDAMGIDPLLMQPALATPPDEIYLLTPEELTRYRLTTAEDES